MSMNRKRFWISISVIAAMLVTTTIAILFLAGSKNDVKITAKQPEDIRAFRQSDAFQNMDRRQRRQTMRQMFMAVADEQAKTYFSLPENQRQMYLDKVIDDMLKRREEFQKMREQRRAEMTEEQQQQARQRREQFRQRRGRGPNPGRMRARAERTNPETRARMSEFRRQLRQRMDERGIEPPRRGPGGPGGGRRQSPA